MESPERDGTHVEQHGDGDVNITPDEGQQAPAEPPAESGGDDAQQGDGGQE